MRANPEELEGRIAGLGLVIVTQNSLDRGFISLTELRSKRSTHKVAGSITIPMESRESGETPAENLARLTTEEIQLRNFSYNPEQVLSQKLCTCELRPGVIVPMYLLEVSSATDVIPGSESQEVAGLRWTQFTEAVASPQNDLRLRPGTREAVWSYLTYWRNPADFKPLVYSYEQLTDHIPSEIFDQIEKGVSLEEALSQLQLASEPSAKSLILARSSVPRVGSLSFA